MEPVPEKGAKTTKVEIVEIGGAGAQNENLGIREGMVKCSSKITNKSINPK